MNGITGYSENDKRRGARPPKAMFMPVNMLLISIIIKLA
jgi:hypothetical protein